MERDPFFFGLEQLAEAAISGSNKNQQKLSKYPVPYWKWNNTGNFYIYCELSILVCFNDIKKFYLYEKYSYLIT